MIFIVEYITQSKRRELGLEKCWVLRCITVSNLIETLILQLLTFGQLLFSVSCFQIKGLMRRPYTPMEDRVIESSIEEDEHTGCSTVNIREQYS